MTVEGPRLGSSGRADHAASIANSNVMHTGFSPGCSAPLRTEPCISITSICGVGDFHTRFARRVRRAEICRVHRVGRWAWQHVAERRQDRIGKDQCAAWHPGGDQRAAQRVVERQTRLQYEVERHPMPGNTFDPFRRRRAGLAETAHQRPTA